MDDNMEVWYNEYVMQTINYFMLMLKGYETPFSFQK